MRAVVQRVTTASVSVGGETVSSIGRGLCVLVGISRDDTDKDIEYIVRKVLNIRLFDGETGKRWDRSVKDLKLEVLCVSQFTLHGFLKGNKPDFHLSMGPNDAPGFYKKFLARLSSSYSADLIKDGKFGDYMQVNIQNDGPVTMCLDSVKESASDELT